MFEEVLFKNRRPDRPASLEEYRQNGGYEALIKAVQARTPDEVRQLVLDSGLRGRGGAGFPTGRKWGFIPADAHFPRYITNAFYVVNEKQSKTGLIMNQLFR